MATRDSKMEQLRLISALYFVNHAPECTKLPMLEGSLVDWNTFQIKLHNQSFESYHVILSFISAVQSS